MTRREDHIHLEESVEIYSGILKFVRSEMICLCFFQPSTPVLLLVSKTVFYCIFDLTDALCSAVSYKDFLHIVQFSGLTVCL